MPMIQNRRQFLTTMSLAGTASLVHGPPSSAAEGTLETTTVRLAKNEGICLAPQYIADELLRAEGFTDVQYVFVPESSTRVRALADGKADFSANFVAPLVVAVASGEPVIVVAGSHVGCYKLFGNESIRSIADLKGKKVGVPGLVSSHHMFVSVMAAHIGLDPVNDIHWVTSQSPSPVELFADGKIDAVLGFPPEPQDLLARGIGHVVVDTTVDPPGRNISAVCWLATASTCGGIRSRPNAYCGPSSKPTSSAPLNPHASRGGSSMAALPLAMTMRCSR